MPFEDDFSRRDLMRLTALLTVGGAMPLLRAHDHGALEADAPVRIGYLPITDATPLLVAHGKGYFEAEGLRAEKPVLLRSWAQLLEAFISGQVNVVHLLSPITVWARSAARHPPRWSRGTTRAGRLSPCALKPAA
ncbi:ABC-type nitrate/sulfonate/bicarbonate transport system substrate-binding protein [Bradyrhizobium canariense]|nr:ABC-type nitrate/sulfonate/bicarbonate transport system substrate-binding protein [Bradyrhizobium canariense]